MLGSRCAELTRKRAARRSRCSPPPALSVRPCLGTVTSTVPSARTSWASWPTSQPRTPTRSAWFTWHRPEARKRSARRSITRSSLCLRFSRCGRVALGAWLVPELGLTGALVQPRAEIRVLPRAACTLVADAASLATPVVHNLLVQQGQPQPHPRSSICGAGGAWARREAV